MTNTFGQIINEIESENKIQAPTEESLRYTGVSEYTKLSEQASIVIIPSHWDGSYVVKKNRYAEKGEELSLLQALSVLEQEDKVLLCLDNGKKLRNF